MFCSFQKEKIKKAKLIPSITKAPYSMCKVWMCACSNCAKEQQRKGRTSPSHRANAACQGEPSTSNRTSKQSIHPLKAHFSPDLTSTRTHSMQDTCFSDQSLPITSPAGIEKKCKSKCNRYTFMMMSRKMAGKIQEKRERKKKQQQAKPKRPLPHEIL